MKPLDSAPLDTEGGRPVERGASAPAAEGVSRERTHPPADENAGNPKGIEEEDPRERVNRRWNEILQETRVAQTGIQILFGFLLSVAFTQRFERLGDFDHRVYVITVVLGAAAIGALIAPVALHRFLSGSRMKDEVVAVAGRFMVCGMVLLALTIGCTLLLLLHTVLTDLLAEILVGAVMAWFAGAWFVLPLILKMRSGRRDD
ncbi:MULTISPECIES: DUF6328 family protein [unclassified Streptomyces]|uniref:DUF6328 family protein n=1 Tax=unclassified Streptomyces TaxID=2593676 RepID=UPI00225BB2EC|nr:MULTISPECIES: DUF6328 family protein [unclassified Streptomyces]MCX5144586.1 DUF6328 family protein [Streptomyces sp. NBC_00338]WRZ68950.1 DUF6328 family protein [Streptomyces sp. NBC_01257]WSU62900.1 DUF6328 family protein [Streptomyces sp. NBC_01104]